VRDFKGNRIMRRRVLNRAATLRIVMIQLLGLSLGLGAVAHAQGDKVLNALTRVEVRESEAATEIIVDGDRPPTFTVFKLSDPIRLFVDVSNADISKVDSPIEVDNGVISQITALQFDDDVVSVGRLIIGLEADALYSVKAEGNALRITVDASQRKTKRPIVINTDPGAREAVAAAEAKAAEAQAQTQAAEAQAQAAEAQAQAAQAQAQAAEAQAQTAQAQARAASAQAQAAETQAQTAEAKARAEAQARAAAQADAASAAQATAAASTRAAAEAKARAEAEAVAAAEARSAAEAQARAEAAEAGAQQGIAAAQTKAAKAEARARAEAAARITAQNKAAEAQGKAAEAQSKAAEAQSKAAEAQSKTARAQAKARAEASARAAAEAKTVAAESRAEVALAEARQATAAAEARAQAAEQVAQARADEASAAARKADEAATALVAARAATASAEQQASAANTDAAARVAAAEARANESEAASKVAQSALAVSESRAREADATRASAQQATARAEAKALEAVAASAAARAAQVEAEQRSQALAQADMATRASATEAEARSRQLAADAEARAQAAAAAEAQARAQAQTAETRAQDAAAIASRQRRAAAQAEAQALAAQQRAGAAEQRAGVAEQRANVAENRASEAEGRAAAAESARQKAEAELAAIAQQRTDAQGRIQALESAQAALNSQLATARAEQNTARTQQLEAEERARQTELSAQQVRLAQLESAKAKSDADQNVAELRAKLVAAEDAAQPDETARLSGELDQARGESAALVEALAARDAELAKARSAADQSRVEADRLAQQLAAGAATPANTADVSAKHRVTDVRFDDEPAQTRIIITVDGSPTYTVRTEGTRTRILEINDAVIDPALERSLDTGEFPSAVQLVSSFQAPPPGDRVRIAVTLGDEVPDAVKLEGNTLVWTFGKPQAAAVAAAPAPANPSTPPAAGYAVAPARTTQPQGFESNRAAAYVGSAQVGSATGSEAPSARRRKRLQKKFRGRKINIDIKDGDIHNILRLLAKEGNVNLVTSDAVDGTVTMHLKLVPWDQALDIILRSKGLDMVREGDIIRVAPAKVIADEREAELAKLEVKEKLEPLAVKLITVNHAKASDLASRVTTVLSNRGKAEADKRTNTIIVKDVADHIEAAVDLVRRLDTQTSQILLQARIVEVNTNESKELGIQWGGNALMSPGTGNATGLQFPGVIGLRGGADDQQTPATGLPGTPNFIVNLPAAAGGGSGGALGMQFGSIDGAFNLNVRLSALENRGTVKIISEPRIATLDNEKASIKDGVRIPISQVSAAGVQTQFFDANLELEVVPQVTQDGNIYLKMKVSKSTPDFQNTAARGDPTILTKEAETKLLLADGETMVIGGIYTSNSGYGFSEVPYLGRIPILGALFRKHNESVQRTELLIFVTPRIMNRRESAVRTGP
jgi:type IV pilus assembly protein PilQ